MLQRHSRHAKRVPISPCVIGKVGSVKLIISSALCMLPATAFAHIGHLGEVAGHDHLVAGVAIGIAIAIGLAGALKGPARDEDEDTADEASAEEAEA